MKKYLFIPVYSTAMFLVLLFLTGNSMGQGKTDFNVPVEQKTSLSLAGHDADTGSGVFCKNNVQITKQTTYLKREMRCAWIATVYNIDYPSTTGLSVNTLKNEFITLITQLKAAGINAVFFQVRPSCDAFYNSPYEPWSQWLSGTQGVAPSGGFDPLVYMIEESHKRGIEFHAWLNPYRAVVSTGSSSIASTHISVTQPSWCVTYNTIKILNPGLPQVRNYVTMIVADIVRRYQVDGIHFDDYFYPYPQSGYTFNDDAAFAADPRGFTNKSDWRRDNVNLLVAMVNDSIKAIKPYVKFGIGPFGIWKNGVPPGITGLSSYDAIYCDPIAWLNDQSIDYVSPQLYWKIGTSQDFNTLADWWGTQASAQGRHCYAGTASYNLNPSGGNWAIGDILNQINSTRAINYKVQGNVFYNASSIADNLKNFADSLAVSYNKYKCLLPTMPWLDSVAPLPPYNVTVSSTPVSVTINWQKPLPASDGDTAKYFVIYRNTDGNAVNIADPKQILFISPDPVTAFTDSIVIASFPGVAYAITSCDKLNNESSPVLASPGMDDIAPSTLINVAGDWQTQSFTVNFTDADNSGGSGIEKRFYQVLDYNGSEWHANARSGFFADSFDSLDTVVWNIPSGGGTWMVSSGNLVQTDTTVNNSNIYAYLNQMLSNRYIYHFNVRLDAATSGTNMHRFGFHFFCDSGSLENRGNSYFIYFRQETSTLEFFKVVNNVFTQTKTVNNIITTFGQWYDIKVIFDRISGKTDVYRNDVLIGSWTDPSPHTTPGNYISFRTGNCKTYINDIMVFRSRYPAVTVSVGDSSIYDIRYQNPDPLFPAAKIRSVVNDSAGNLSSVSTFSLNIDWTLPPCVAVNDGNYTDTDTTSSLNTLSANWTASGDSNSGISKYLYAIGTSPGSADIAGWTGNGTNTTVTRSGLSLIDGQTYFFSVQVINGAELTSICSSDGVLVNATANLSENDLAPLILVYPNPFSKSVTIHVQVPAEQYLNIGITDIQGRQVLNFGRLFAEGDNKIDLNPETIKLSKGMYLLEIRNKDKVKTEKIIRF